MEDSGLCTADGVTFDHCNCYLNPFYETEIRSKNEGLGHIQSVF